MPQTDVRLFRDAQGVVLIHDWLAELERRDSTAYAKCVQRILSLSQLGYELRRPLADMLRDGIYELRIRRGRRNYRMLYFFHDRNAVVLSHGLAKEDVVPDREIDLALEHKALCEKDSKKYTAEWNP